MKKVITTALWHLLLDDDAYAKAYRRVALVNDERNNHASTNQRFAKKYGRDDVSIKHSKHTTVGNQRVSAIVHFTFASEEAHTMFVLKYS